jgi:hypothetical protein
MYIYISSLERALQLGQVWTRVQPPKGVGKINWEHIAMWAIASVLDSCVHSWGVLGSRATSA